MNELIEEYIEPFSYAGFKFSGCTMYSIQGSEYRFLMSGKGCSFICTKELGEQLVAHMPTKEFMQKLSSRGFCENSERFNVRKKLPILPGLFAIDFTTKCNMNCYYCLRNFENEGKNITKEKLTDILEYISEYYHSNRMKNISIQAWGGEPLLAIDEIVYMRQFLCEHNVNACISVQTNALLLDDINIEKIEKNDIEIGVSLDGCVEIQDIHRKDIAGNSTYQRVVQNIKKYTGLTNKKVGTISVISRMSIPYIEKSMELLVNEAEIDRFKFNFMHSNSELFDESSVVDETDIEQFWSKVFDMIFKLNESGHQISEYNISDKLENLLTGGGCDICHSNGCTGGYRFISFSQDGKIYPCEMIGVSEYQLGDIYEGSSIPEILKRNVEIANPYFAEKTKDECKTCPWLYFCMGGCTAAARFNGKKQGEIDDKECASNKVIYRALIRYILENPNNANVLSAGKFNLE